MLFSHLFMAPDVRDKMSELEVTLLGLRGRSREYAFNALNEEYGAPRSDKVERYREMIRGDVAVGELLLYDYVLNQIIPGINSALGSAIGTSEPLVLQNPEAVVNLYCHECVPPVHTVTKPMQKHVLESEILEDLRLTADGVPADRLRHWYVPCKSHGRIRDLALVLNMFESSLGVDNNPFYTLNVCVKNGNRLAGKIVDKLSRVPYGLPMYDPVWDLYRMVIVTSSSQNGRVISELENAMIMAEHITNDINPAGRKRFIESGTRISNLDVHQRYRPFECSVHLLRDCGKLFVPHSEGKLFSPADAKDQKPTYTAHTINDWFGVQTAKRDMMPRGIPIEIQITTYPHYDASLKPPLAHPMYLKKKAGIFREFKEGLAGIYEYFVSTQFFHRSPKVISDLNKVPYDITRFL